MKLVVGFACTRTLLTLSNPIQHFAFAQLQQSGCHRAHVRLSTTFRCKAATSAASARENMGSDVGFALFDATGTLMHLKEPVGETYSRYATIHGLQVGTPADLELRFKTTYINTVRFGVKLFLNAPCFHY